MFYYMCMLWMFDQRVALRALIRTAMSETGGNLQKRMLREVEDVDDVVKPKSPRTGSDEIVIISSDETSSSSGSDSPSSSKEQTTSDTTSSDDLNVPISFGPVLPQFDSQVDAWKR